MNRGRLLLASTCILLLFAAFVLWDVFRSPEPSEDAQEIATVTEVPPPAEPEPAPVERRSIPITGFVFGDGLAPREGITVWCGAESAVTSSSGSFGFPAAVRPRGVSLRVAKSESDLAVWADVLAGDPQLSEIAPGADDAPSTPAYRVEDSAVPALPERIRWTVVLPSPGDEAPRTGKWIRLREAFSEEWGNGARTRIRGTTALPDGAHVAVSLYFDSARFLGALEPAEVKGGRFTAFLGCPAEVQFFPASYEARASFNLLLETSAVVEEWKKARPDVDWDSLVLPEVAQVFRFGDPEEDKRDNLAAQAYYGEMLDQAKRLDRELKETLRSRVDERRVFAEGRGLSAKSRTQGPKAWLNEAFLQPEGQVDVVRWRRFLDEDWRPRVRALREKHAARTQEKYKEAASRLGSLLKSLLDESYCFSRFCVYKELQLPLDDADFYPDEDQAGDMVRLENLVRDNMLSLERYRRLDDGSVIQPESK